MPYNVNMISLTIPMLKKLTKAKLKKLRLIQTIFIIKCKVENAPPINNCYNQSATNHIMHNEITILFRNLFLIIITLAGCYKVNTMRVYMLKSWFVLPELGDSRAIYRTGGRLHLSTHAREHVNKHT